MSMIYENAFPTPSPPHSIRTLRNLLVKKLFFSYKPPLSKSLPPEALHFLTSSSLSRYLVARADNIDKALKVAVMSWNWRVKRRMATATTLDEEEGRIIREEVRLDGRMERSDRNIPPRRSSPPLLSLFISPG